MKRQIKLRLKIIKHAEEETGNISKTCLKISNKY